MYLQIETERLRISPLEEEDDLFMFELLNSQGWIENIGDRNIETLEDAVAYIRKIKGTPGYFYNVIRSRVSNMEYGLVTLLFRPGQEYPDLGFALLPQMEGHGFAYEAAAAYLKVLGEQYPNQKISGITLPTNTRSITLLEKLGFKFQERRADGAEVLNVYLR